MLYHFIVKNLFLTVNCFRFKNCILSENYSAISDVKFFNIIIIPMEPYQPNGWKTEICSTDLQFGLCGSGRKTKNLKLQPIGLKITTF
jgi:hypothetical protein